MKTFLATTAVLAAVCSAPAVAQGGNSAQVASIIEQLENLGYTDIEIQEGDALILVESRRGRKERRFMVLKSTGEILGDTVRWITAEAPSDKTRRQKGRVLTAVATKKRPPAEPEQEDQSCYLSGLPECEPDSESDPEAYQDWREGYERLMEEQAEEEEQAKDGPAAAVPFK